MKEKQSTKEEIDSNHSKNIDDKKSSIQEAQLATATKTSGGITKIKRPSLNLQKRATIGSGGDDSS